MHEHHDAPRRGLMATLAATLLGHRAHRARCADGGTAQGSGPDIAGTVVSGAGEALHGELPRYLFYGMVAALVAFVALSIGAQAALAQPAPGGGGGGDAIQSTLTNVRDYLAALSFSVGGIGFVASLLVKGYASINENAHAYAAMGMKGSLWCIVAGVIVTPILTIAAGLAGGGG